MAKTIFDLVEAPHIATYYTNNVSNTIPYLGSLLFPVQKQVGLDLSWIRGYNGLPVSLAPSAFDAKAPVRDRIGISKIESEMPFFRESFRIGEKERQELLKVMSGMNAAIIEPIIKRIYDDVTNLVDGAAVIPERMIMQLLSTGKIHVASADGMAYAYDYKHPNKHKAALTGNKKWSDTENSDVVGDIMDWTDQVEQDTGIRPTKAICTRKTWGYIVKNKKIRLDMNPIGGQSIIVTDRMIKQYLLDKLGLQVSVYNKMFSQAVGNQGEKFFPDEIFSLIPDGKLGTTYYGTTPEEADLMSGQSQARVSIVNTGVAITTFKEIHPVNSVTVVSEIVLPTFEAIDSVFIAKVG